MSTEVTVLHLPNCDLCAQLGEMVEAHYDGKTISGPWAYMCERHFKTLGVGLGTGRGQRLVLGKPPSVEDRRRALLEAADRGDLDAMEEAVGDGDITDLL